VHMELMERGSLSLAFIVLSLRIYANVFVHVCAEIEASFE
jgi:hypothetical protein